ncbi:hypothetical protein F5Y04DRAFT_241509 [Hypomontagnella monticulosa]|nr:hypothetical protein F5Y04DRAFT_241509 [Hypomontagnella monticulosa]
MDKLPHEILFHILEWTVVAFYSDKNNLLKLRTTCKLFDDVLKRFALRTLQLEFTRLDKSERKVRPPDDDALFRAGPFCRALYLDMMVVRDDNEVMLLDNLFARVPAMDNFVSSLLHRYCMNETSFTEIDYRNQLGAILEHAPKVTAVKLNLPFQLAWTGQYRAGTMILGNTFEALAQRPEESETLKTLVLENLCDMSVVSLWRNPQDVKNIIIALADLTHLFLSVRRHEGGNANNINFRNRLWEMIGKAEKLESLCLVDLDAEGKHCRRIRTSSQRDLTLEEWQFRCIPTIRKPPKSVLPNLTYLELRQVEVMGSGLLSVFRCFANSLQELYLDAVYLKTVYSTESPQDAHNTLWIGLPNMRPPPNHRWIATYLRQIQVQLRVCHVSSLGYDQYVMGEQLPEHSVTYDLEDPSDLDRTLEERFVEVVMGIEQPPAPDDSDIVYLPEDSEQDSWALGRCERTPSVDQMIVDAVVKTGPSPASVWQRSIDGQFPNCNQYTLDALHGFANNAYKGMTLLNELSDQRVADLADTD